MGVLARSAAMVMAGAGLAGMALVSAIGAGAKRRARRFRRRGFDVAAASRAITLLSPMHRRRLAEAEREAGRGEGIGLGSFLLSTLLVQGLAGARRAGAFRRGTMLDSLTTVGSIVIPMIMRPRPGRARISGLTQKLVGVGFYLTGAAATLVVRRYLDRARPAPAFRVAEGRSATGDGAVTDATFTQGDAAVQTP
jgi:hypothetical protein